jgi:hypothetical protein
MRMNRNYIDRHLVIDRYLQGKLAEGEEAEFEERLVWDRELVDELDLAANLQAGLRVSAAESKYIGGESEGLAWRLKGAMSMPRYAAAASFALGALLTSMLVNNMDTGSDPFRIDTMPTTVMPLMVLRSSDVQTIPVEPDGMTVFMIDVPLTYTSYRASIRREQASEPFWTQADLVPGYTEALAVGVPGSALAPATYFLTIEGLSDDAVTFIQEIPFRTLTVD